MRLTISRLHSSPTVANQLNDLVRGRQPPTLLLGIDFLPVNENVQRTWSAQPDASGNLQLAFDALFQAHGLRLDVVSKETALDFDVHSGLLKDITMHCSKSCGRSSTKLRVCHSGNALIEAKTELASKMPPVERPGCRSRGQAAGVMTEIVQHPTAPPAAPTTWRLEHRGFRSTRLRRKIRRFSYQRGSDASGHVCLPARVRIQSVQVGPGDCRETSRELFAPTPPSIAGSVDERADSGLRFLYVSDVDQNVVVGAAIETGSGPGRSLHSNQPSPPSPGDNWLTVTTRSGPV